MGPGVVGAADGSLVGLSLGFSRSCHGSTRIWYMVKNSVRSIGVPTPSSSLLPLIVSPNRGSSGHGPVQCTVASNLATISEPLGNVTTVLAPPSSM